MTETQSERATERDVRIHIDRVSYRSPNPTNGEALYVLGNVKPGLALFQEVEGNKEDRLIPNSKEEVPLHEDEHFYSAHPHRKVFTIIVNGRPKEVDHKVVTFDEIVALSNITGDANTIFTVTYKKGRHDAQGTMVQGDKVKVKDGMIFNVKATSKS